MQVQVQAAMASQLGKHVVEERQPCGDVRRAGPVEGEDDGDLGLFRGAVPLGATQVALRGELRHPRSFSRLGRSTGGKLTTGGKLAKGGKLATGGRVAKGGKLAAGGRD